MASERRDADSNSKADAALDLAGTSCGTILVAPGSDATAAEDPVVESSPAPWIVAGVARSSASHVRSIRSSDSQSLGTQADKSRALQ